MGLWLPAVSSDLNSSAKTRLLTLSTLFNDLFSRIKLLADILHLNDVTFVDIIMNNASRVFFIVLLTAFNSSLCFAQLKDEAFSSRIDPVKVVQVFPNPATEFLSIKFETPIAKKVSFTVHNVIGNEMDITPELLDEYQVQIKVKDFHEGYYFVSMQMESSKATHKFLKR
jgi:Secretion system C-terminal sorting domain